MNPWYQCVQLGAYKCNQGTLSQFVSPKYSSNLICPNTADGKTSGEPVEVGSLKDPAIYKETYTSQVVVWDFWTINSITPLCLAPVVVADTQLDHRDRWAPWRLAISCLFWMDMIRERCEIHIPIGWIYGFHKTGIFICIYHTSQASMERQICHTWILWDRCHTGWWMTESKKWCMK